MYRYLLVFLLRLFIGPYFCLLDYLTSKIKLAIEEIAQFRTWYNVSIKTAVACEISLLSTKVTLEGNHMNTACLIDIHRSNKETTFIYFWITFTFRLQHSNVCFCWLSVFFLESNPAFKEIKIKIYYLLDRSLVTSDGY